MQPKGLLLCLQQPITGPPPEPNKSSCHSSNQFQICWKNQLLVPSSLSICLVQMEQHNFQQTAVCNVIFEASKEIYWHIQILVKIEKKGHYMNVYVPVVYCEWSI
jgi:hypothetical protein